MIDTFAQRISPPRHQDTKESKRFFQKTNSLFYVLGEAYRARGYSQKVINAYRKAQENEPDNTWLKSVLLEIETAAPQETPQETAVEEHLKSKRKSSQVTRELLTKFSTVVTKAITTMHTSESGLN